MKNLKSAIMLILTCKILQSIWKSRFFKITVLFAVMWLLTGGLFTGIISMLIAAIVCTFVSAFIFKVNYYFCKALNKDKAISAFFTGDVDSFTLEHLHFCFDALLGLTSLHITSLLCSGMSTKNCNTAIGILAGIIIAVINRKKK